jgi:hypothetical protein
MVEGTNAVASVINKALRTIAVITASSWRASIA